MSNYEGFYYSNEEKEELVGISDVIIMEEDRRKQGEYFTPDILTIKADEYLWWHLGNNYKDEYFVWDCAAGTGNLTRNFEYKHLYQSTLHKSDLQTMKQSNINPEGTKFQFDFLNDDLDKIPNDLMDAIRENKKILFYINPPYMRAGDFSASSKEEKDVMAKGGVSSTSTSDDMLKNKWGNSSSNLYAQFLYKIWKMKKDFNLSNLSIGLFCPELFISGSDFDKFRDNFLKDFKYENGFLTPASLFSDVSKQWGILFSIWTNGQTNNANDFSVEIYDTDDSLNVENKGTKLLYNLDNLLSASEWIRKNEKRGNIEIPFMTNAINVGSPKSRKPVKFHETSIGYMLNLGNNVYYNQQGVSIFSTTYNQPGVVIDKDNLLNICTLFTSRKLIQANWVNQKQEYMAPDETNPEWEQFKCDSIIYSLFNSASNQSALRDINYNNKKWNSFNEFFWVPIEKMREIIKQSSNQDLYNDIKLYGKQRYVAQLLYDEGIYGKLSEDAKFVLDEATKYVVKSIGIRDIVNRERPELNANTWDAGFYQLKGIANTIVSHKNDIKIIMDAYKEFGNRLRPLVYELGFLK